MNTNNLETTFEKSDDGLSTYVIRPLYEGEFALSDDTPMEDFLHAQKQGLRIVPATADGRIRETLNQWLNTDPERVKYAKAHPEIPHSEIPDTILPPGYSGYVNDTPVRGESVFINERRPTFDYSDDMPIQDFWRLMQEGKAPRFK